MDLIEAFVCGCLGNWLYNKGKKEGQDEVVKEYNELKSQELINQLRIEIQEMKRLNPPESKF